jgi:folylpolyglutamate synthase
MVASREASVLLQKFSFRPDVSSDLTAVGIPPSDLAHLKTQQELASAWRILHPDFLEQSIHVLPSIEHGIQLVRSLESVEQEIDVLVTGSLHLVGGVIEVAGLSEAAL